MPTCPNCGAGVQQGVNACHNCGTTLHWGNQGGQQGDQQRGQGSQGRKGGQQGGPPGGQQGGQPGDQQSGQPDGRQGGQPGSQQGGQQGGPPGEQPGGQQRGPPGGPRDDQPGGPQGGQAGGPQNGQSGGPQGGPQGGQSGGPRGGQQGGPPGGWEGSRGQQTDDGGLGRRELLAGGGVLAAVGAVGLFAFLRSGDGDDDSGGNGEDDGGSGGGGNGDESSDAPSSPGESRDTAPPLPEGRHGPYEITNGGEHYFALDLQEGDELTVTIYFSHAEGDLDLELQNSQGTFSDPAYNSQSFTDNETIAPQIEESGTYYVRIYRFGTASNSYEIEVEIN